MIKKIACLPVAGIENPYQYLMIKGLNKSKSINAFNGVDDRFFGIFKTWLKHRPHYIHFDWIHSFYIRRTSWMTYVMLPLFIIQVLHIRFFTDTKIVWTLHNIIPHSATNLFVNKLVRSFFANQCIWIRVFSKKTVFKASETFNVKQYKFKVIPEGDYTNFYKNEITLNDARKSLNYKKSEKIVLFLGFIRPYKGLEKLIKTFDIIKDKNLRLLLVGHAMDINYLSKLEELINSCEHKKRITLKNCFISDDELQIYYNAANLVVLPFDNIENSGSAILAMGFSKPIIAPKKGVLLTRLSSQKDLLYNDLELTLKYAFNLEAKYLRKLGENNFKSLRLYKWSDFGKAFD